MTDKPEGDWMSALEVVHKRCASYHEAGHATAAFLYGYPVVSVRIYKGDKSHRWGGETKQASFGEAFLNALATDDPRREANAPIAMAGTTAETIFMATLGNPALVTNPDLYAACDLEIADASLASVKPGHATFGRFRGRALAKELLDQPEVWLVVQAIAAAVYDKGAIWGNKLKELLQPLETLAEPPMTFADMLKALD